MEAPTSSPAFAAAFSMYVSHKTYTNKYSTFSFLKTFTRSTLDNLKAIEIEGPKDW